MNRLSQILTLCFCISCKNNSRNGNTGSLPVNSKNIQAQLADNLGRINMFIPLRYDISFSWIHYSDCGKPCEEHKYRFQSKFSPIIKESGFYWSRKLCDSIDQMTMSHRTYMLLQDADTVSVRTRHELFKNELLLNSQNSSIVFDTIQKIGDRNFFIIALERSDSIQSVKVFAITTIKGNEIKFAYELVSSKNDSIQQNFIKNSISLIKTIQLNTEH